MDILSVLFLFLEVALKRGRGVRRGGGIIYIIFVTLYHFTSMFSFILEYRNIEREHLPEIDLGTSFFLVEILRKYIHLAGEFS